MAASGISRAAISHVEPPELPGPLDDPDPVQQAIAALTRNRVQDSKQKASPDGLRSCLHMRLDAAPPKGSSSSPLDSPLSSKAPRSGRRSLAGNTASPSGTPSHLGSALGMRPTRSNVFVVHHSDEHATVTPPSQHFNPSLLQPTPRSSLPGTTTPLSCPPQFGSPSALRCALLASDRTGGPDTPPSSGVRFDVSHTPSFQRSSALQDSLNSLSSTGEPDGAPSPGTSRVAPRFGRRADTGEMQAVGGSWDHDERPSPSTQLHPPPPRRSLNGLVHFGSGHAPALSSDGSFSSTTGNGSSNRAAVAAIEAQAEAARSKFLRLVSGRQRGEHELSHARTSSFIMRAASMGGNAQERAPQSQGGVQSQSQGGASGRSSGSMAAVVGGGPSVSSGAHHSSGHHSHGSSMAAAFLSKAVHAAAMGNHSQTRLSAEAAALPFKSH